MVGEMLKSAKSNGKGAIFILSATEQCASYAWASSVAYTYVFGTYWFSKRHKTDGTYQYIQANQLNDNKRDSGRANKQHLLPKTSLYPAAWSVKRMTRDPHGLQGDPEDTNLATVSTVILW
jgi:hypothetical protein